VEPMKAHVDKMEAQLRRWGLNLDKLANKSEVGAEAKVNYLRNLDELIVKHRTVRIKLDELKAAGYGQWENFKDGVDTALCDLECTLQGLTK
jgi:hypothetical protein